MLLKADKPSILTRYRNVGLRARLILTYTGRKAKDEFSKSEMSIPNWTGISDAVVCFWYVYILNRGACRDDKPDL